MVMPCLPLAWGGGDVGKRGYTETPQQCITVPHTTIDCEKQGVRKGICNVKGAFICAGAMWFMTSDRTSAPV